MQDQRVAPNQLERFVGQARAFQSRRDDYERFCHLIGSLLELTLGFDYTAKARAATGFWMGHWQNGLEAAKIEAKGIEQLCLAFEHQLGPQFDEAVVTVLNTSGRVIVSGIGKSGHVGRKFAATLSSTGTPAQFIHPSEASHGDLGAITKNDAVILISNSGESGELSAIVEHCKRFDIASVGITAAPESTLARNVKIVLHIPKAEEACPNGLAPTTSTTLQLVLCDALAVTLLKARKFMPSDFRVYHPGGQLGAQIRTVQSLMHTGKELPVVPLKVTMREAIIEMSGKGFGIIGIVDEDQRVVGVISDGDLRRHIADAGLLDMPVSSVMTKNPRVIDADALVSEAARNMELNKISALFVLDGNHKLTGLIRFSDLLRSGVV
jgi:arabinose-5-phosphate isomerase